MEPEKIERINELAKAKKERELSCEEATEHEALRKEYIEGFKANMRKVLEGVKVQQPDGTVKPLEKKKKSN